MDLTHVKIFDDVGLPLIWYVVRIKRRVIVRHTSSRQTHVYAYKINDLFGLDGCSRTAVQNGSAERHLSADQDILLPSSGTTSRWSFTLVDQS